MSDVTYTFEEFCDHMAAMEIVKDYRHVTLANGDTIELTDGRCFESMVPRVMDYMRQIYADHQEAFFKGSRLLMILNHASSDMQAFEDAGLAVIGGSGKASLIHPRAWRALHHFYAVLPMRSASRTSTEEIVAYAKTLPEEPEA